MLTILLYTKDGCGLCDDVKHDLAELQARFPHQVAEVDITLDTAVFEAYKHIIPVIKIEDKLLQAPITKANLEAALRQVYEVEE